MGMGFWYEAREHRDAAEDLYETTWWQELMNDPHFKNLYERNYNVRLNMSSADYIRKLINSETERRTFVEAVLHPPLGRHATPDQE
ncbi:hypothetical protein CIG75_10270 [Tumebacillus algifaecis]|uniref:Uncharacterized protein n=1 Tax=Tumebacillus algifaecis TaxID=1214604 RepID=A0A223D1T6_9BACL|nr:hypothetical protein [Tumebacillus algifaecis]ASS75337.1 hypothetical protein CIG75_10270 [Tumebacillus algifaecis]